jgi:hypothetical protein
MNYLKAFLPYLFGNKVGKPLVLVLPEKVKWGKLSFEEQLCFHCLNHTLDNFLDSLNWGQFSPKEIFHLINFQSFLSLKNRQKISENYAREILIFNEATSACALTVSELQNLLVFPNQKCSLFAIVPRDRARPGRLVIRLASGAFLQNARGDVWSIPILAHTCRGLSFNHSYGHTPCGIYTIDGVMPEANFPLEFGEYRRLIVNFLSPSGVDDYQDLLPRGHWSLHWWKQSLLAGLLGRSLLRIHGTGYLNFNIFSSYFPFVPTSGCLATMETRAILGHKITHQRELLDALMMAQGLDKSFENEMKIHGLLYVVEFDGSLSALEFKV